MRRLTQKRGIGRPRTDKGIKDELWAMFSEYIRKRDRRCVTCSKVAHWRELDAGHYLPNTERNKTMGGNCLWYDERNFGGQCYRCNRLNHGEQAKFAEYLENRFGYGILQHLREKIQVPKKYKREELLELIKLYKARTKNLT